MLSENLAGKRPWQTIARQLNIVNLYAKRPKVAAIVDIQNK